MSLSPLKLVQTLLASAVVLSVPAFAVCTLLPGAARPGYVELADGDDPIHHGLRIVNQASPSRPEPSLSRAGQGTDEILLSEWSFTAKGKPSPYN